MPKAPSRHRPAAVHAPRHIPSEPSRQARRALSTCSAAWRKIRAEQLGRSPVCVMCYAKGVLRQANQVDHINGDAMNNDPSNLQSLCCPCHSRKTAQENGGFGNRPANPSVKR